MYVPWCSTRSRCGWATRTVPTSSWARSSSPRCSRPRAARWAGRAGHRDRVMAYAILGTLHARHHAASGASWASLVNHLYLTSQGIYGTALGVIATYVFHFVLFGVLATRMGLGQLFIDLASALAGRYAGGPAKVSVLSSAMLGIDLRLLHRQHGDDRLAHHPRDDQDRLRPHFAAAVEAASSTGGQITPPVMGAVALPDDRVSRGAADDDPDRRAGARIHALLRRARAGPHRGEAARPARVDEEELPDAWLVFKSNSLAIAPLVVLVWVLLSGRTPYAAAFWGSRPASA